MEGAEQNTRNAYSIALDRICEELIDVYCKKLIYENKLLSIYEFYDGVENNLASRLLQLVDDYYVKHGLHKTYEK